MFIVFVPLLLGLFAFLIRRYFFKQEVKLGRITDWWMLVLGVIIGTTIFFADQIHRAGINQDITIFAYIASNWIILLFVTINLNKPAFIFLFIGGVLNIIAIMTNSGMMPLLIEYANLIYGSKYAIDGLYIPNTYSIILENPNLMYLSDIILVHIPDIHTTVISLGDVFMFAGIFMYFSGE